MRCKKARETESAVWFFTICSGQMSKDTEQVAAKKAEVSGRVCRLPWNSSCWNMLWQAHIYLSVSVTHGDSDESFVVGKLRRLIILHGQRGKASSVRISSLQWGNAVDWCLLRRQYCSVIRGKLALLLTRVPCILQFQSQIWVFWCRRSCCQLFTYQLFSCFGPVTDCLWLDKLVRGHFSLFSAQLLPSVFARWFLNPLRCFSGQGWKQSSRKDGRTKREVSTRNYEGSRIVEPRE